VSSWVDLGQRFLALFDVHSCALYVLVVLARWMDGGCSGGQYLNSSSTNSSVNNEVLDVTNRCLKRKFMVVLDRCLDKKLVTYH
jgi:hypothetical protein